MTGIHVARKVKHGIAYLYLERTARVNGKSKRVWQKYLGKEDELLDNIDLHVKGQYSMRVLEFGLPALMFDIAREIRLVDIIDECTEKRDQGLSVGDHVLLAAINRCVKPASKTKLKAWLDKTYLQFMMPPIDVNVDARAYWTHFFYLTDDAIENIENRLCQQIIKQYNLTLDCVLFDPTNFYTYINPSGDETLPEHGHSKENRLVLNIINLSLFCLKDGAIPLFHETYAGNVPDASHFKEVIPKFIGKLKAFGFEPADTTLVFDKGNISDDAFAWIDAEHLQYIVTVRPTSHKDLLSIPPDEFIMYELPNGKNIGCLEYRREMHGVERRLVAVYNPPTAEWQRENMEEKIAKKIDKVTTYFKNRLNAGKWRDKDAVNKKIAALVGKGVISGLITWDAWIDDDGHVHVGIERNETAIADHVNTFGKSFLMTSHDDWLAVDVAWMERQQYEIERVFHWLKDPDLVAIRPMYHRKDHSIKGHAFTCVIAYLLLALACRKLINKGLIASIEDMTTLLDEIKVVRTTFRGTKQVVDDIAEISDDARKILDFLNLERFLQH